MMPFEDDKPKRAKIIRYKALRGRLRPGQGTITHSTFNQSPKKVRIRQKGGWLLKLSALCFLRLLPLARESLGAFSDPLFFGERPVDDLGVLSLDLHALSARNVYRRAVHLTENRFVAVLRFSHVSSLDNLLGIGG